MNDKLLLAMVTPPPSADNAEIASVVPCVAPTQGRVSRPLYTSLYRTVYTIPPPRPLFLVRHSKQGDRPKHSMAGGGHFRESRMKRSSVCGSADLVFAEPVRVCVLTQTDDCIEHRFADLNSWTRLLNDGTTWCVLGLNSVPCFCTLP
jgi:hypothetical protein